MSVRKNIRNIVKIMLDSSGLFTTVAIGRRHNYTAAQLPAAGIYTDGEETEVISLTPRRLEHTMDLTVEIYLKPAGATCGEDQLETILDAVDARVVAAVKGVATVFDAAPASLEVEGDGDEADADYIKATRRYSVVYQTQDLLIQPNTNLILVDGAGSSAVDGPYLADGTANDAPRYTLLGGTTGVDSIEVGDELDTWYIKSTAGDLYNSTDLTLADTPDLAAWESDSGDDPAPTVTSITWAQYIQSLLSA
jgi:hypothetical protein